MTAITRRSDATEGEIPLLDADRLEDHRHAEARAAGGSSFGDRDDDRAIGRLTAQLKRTPAGAKLSDDALQEKVIDLYNKLCDNIRTGAASETQVDQAAQIFGESAEHLRERLNPTPQPDESGAGGLFAALRG